MSKGHFSLSWQMSVNLTEVITVLLVLIAVPTVKTVEPSAVVRSSKTMRDQKKALRPLLGPHGPLTENSDWIEIKMDKEFHDRVPPASQIAGSLSIIAMREPDPDKLYEEFSDSYRHLHLDFEGEEWGALFYDVFNCPAVIDEPDLPNQSEEERQNRFSQKFKTAIPEYPMLGRIWDIFIYVSYKPEEVSQLRSECIKVQKSTSNEKALRGLGKLVRACDEASKNSFGLLFVPD